MPVSILLPRERAPRSLPSLFGTRVRYRTIWHHQGFPQFDWIDPQALGVAFRDADSRNERLTALAQSGDFLISIMQGIGLGAAVYFTRR